MRRRMMGVLAGGVVMCVGIGVWGQQAATRPGAGDGVGTMPSGGPIGRLAIPGKVPFTISKETTAITGPLRADGTVDYVAALNEKYGRGVTPENNGFVVWLQVVGTGDDVISPKIRAKILIMCGAKETAAGAEVWMSYADYLKQAKGLNGGALDAAADELSDTWLAYWKAEAHPDVAAYLKKQEALMAIVAQAAGRPKWWSPSVASDGRTVVSVLLPSLGLVRDVGNALCARATLRAGNGDIDGFLADIGTLRKLARLVGSGQTLIERLVGAALETRAVEAVAGVVGTGGLTEAQCKSVLGALDGFTTMPGAVEGVDIAERWDNLDMVAVIATGRMQLLKPIDNGGDGMPSMDQLLRTINGKAVDWDGVLKQINGFIDEEVRAMRRMNFAEMRDAMAALDKRVAGWAAEAKTIKGGVDFSQNTGETRAAYSQRVAKDIMAVLMPTVARAEELIRRCNLEAQMARVVVAAAEIKAKKGTWPARAEELVPDMLKELPKDMYSAGSTAALKYEVTKAGVRLYSVGRNGKDDGGINDRDKGMDDVAVGAGD